MKSVTFPCRELCEKRVLFQGTLVKGITFHFRILLRVTSVFCNQLLKHRYQADQRAPPSSGYVVTLAVRMCVYMLIKHGIK